MQTAEQCASACNADSKCKKGRAIPAMGSFFIRKMGMTHASAKPASCCLTPPPLAPRCRRRAMVVLPAGHGPFWLRNRVFHSQRLAADGAGGRVPAVLRRHSRPERLLQNASFSCTGLLGGCSHGSHPRRMRCPGCMPQERHPAEPRSQPTHAPRGGWAAAGWLARADRSALCLRPTCLQVWRLGDF